MRLTKEQLLASLRDELGIETSGLNDDSPLFSSGIIDSFSLVSLIIFIEGKGVRVDPMDINLDNLDSVERILRFANRADD